MLVEAGAPVDARGMGGWTPLHMACLDGHLDIARMFIEAGALVDIRGEDGWTPLHWACLFGHLEVVRCLVEEGHADMHAVDDDGETPMAWTQRRGKSDVVAYLRGRIVLKKEQEAQEE